jgi:hypothetical protein
MTADCAVETGLQVGSPGLEWALRVTIAVPLHVRGFYRYGSHLPQNPLTILLSHGTVWTGSTQMGVVEMFSWGMVGDPLPAPAWGPEGDPHFLDLTGLVH